MFGRISEQQQHWYELWTFFVFLVEFSMFWNFWQGRQPQAKYLCVCLLAFFHCGKYESMMTFDKVSWRWQVVKVGLWLNSQKWWVIFDILLNSLEYQKKLLKIYRKFQRNNFFRITNATKCIINFTCFYAISKSSKTNINGFVRSQNK